MFDDDSPGLGVDFAIDPNDSFSQIAQLRSAMNAAQGSILSNAGKIEGGVDPRCGGVLQNPIRHDDDRLGHLSALP